MTKAEKTVVELVQGLIESSFNVRKEGTSPYREGISDGYLYAAGRLLTRLALNQLED